MCDQLVLYDSNKYRNTASIVIAYYIYACFVMDLSSCSGHGGYQQNVTAGINWYPDNGFAFQFNATHVMSLKSPLNWNPQSSYYEGDSHPTFLEMRAKVYF